MIARQKHAQSPIAMHCFSFLFYLQTSLARNKSKSQQRDCALEEVIITGNDATQFSIPPTVPTLFHIAVISPPPHPVGEVLAWPKPCEESIHEETDCQLNIVPVLWEKGSTPRESTPPCQQPLEKENFENIKRGPPSETEHCAQMHCAQFHSVSLHAEGPLVSPSSRPPPITLLPMLHHTAQPKSKQPPVDTTEEFFPEHMIPSARMLDVLLLPETGIA